MPGVSRQAKPQRLAYAASHIPAIPAAYRCLASSSQIPAASCLFSPYVKTSRSSLTGMTAWTPRLRR
jgi:hypothetical protein